MWGGESRGQFYGTGIEHSGGVGDDTVGGELKNPKKNKMPKLLFFAGTI